MTQAVVKIDAIEGILIPAEYRNKKIDNLIPYVNNARTHSDEQVTKIAASIKEFGFNNPILIDRNNGVIAGHGRLLAAKRLGMTEVPTVSLDHLSDAQRKAYILADNRLAMDAGWDAPLLKIEFEILSESGIDLSITGFNADEIQAYMNPIQLNDGLTDADTCDGLGGDPVAKPGDVFILNQHRVMCGDSTSIDAIEKLFTEYKSSLCFTSPPYADQREYNGGKELSTQHLASFIRTSFDKCDLFAVNLGISRKGNEINTYWDDYIKEAKECGLKLLSWNIWDRSGFGYTIGQATAMFTIDHEFIFVFGLERKELNKNIPNKTAGIEKSSTIRQTDGNTTPTTTKTNNFRQLGTVIRTDTNRYVGGSEHMHPATFPIELVLNYVEACTSPNEYVYDPFGGSGTTLIACEKIGRHCLMMELDPRYVDMIIRRWQKFTGHQAILESTGKPFNELAI